MKLPAWVPHPTAWATAVALFFFAGGVSMAMAVIDPPPVDPDAMRVLAWEMTRDFSGLARALVWIVIAAYVYELERAARCTTSPS